MKVKNTILKGMVQDIDPRNQPEGTWRDSRNGMITQDGNIYTWRPAKGTAWAMNLAAGEQLMNYCNIRDRYFAITFNETQQVVNIWELFSEEDNDEIGDEIQKSLKWWGSNAGLNLSNEHPIRVMFGIYENEEIQRIYWSDDWNQPRVLNVAESGQISLDEKFLDFVPELQNAYGTFNITAILTGGNLRAGSYSFCWRFYTGDGYYSDWSFLSNPVPITGNAATNSYDGYQDYQGMAPGENTSKSLSITLTDLDEDYPSIQLASFYSNADNSVEPGIIFYDGSLSATSILVTFRGNENLGTVTLEDITTTSITIEKIKDMATIKNRNIVANIKEREELDVSNMNTELRNDRMEVTVDTIQQQVVLDSIIGVGPVSPSLKAAYGAPHATTIGLGTIYGGLWYKVISLCTWQEYGGGPTYTNLPIGATFIAPDRGTISGGYVKAIIRIKKYRKAGIAGPYKNGDCIAQSTDPDPYRDDYIWDETLIEYSHYLDWKNPIIANKLRGYPGGEKVRLGVIYFDLSGRPFFARWLNNRNPDLGFGDITTPKRGNFPNPPVGIRHTVGYSDTTTGEGTTYAQINGITVGLKVSGLDITDIKDNISGFMIVRAPIIHQYLATGAIMMTVKDDNETYQYPGFMNWAADVVASRREKTYAFFCPEHLFNAEGFQIQDGDELENMDIFWPYLQAKEEHTGWYGFGEEDVSNVNYIFYQKFMLGLLNGTGNAAAGVKHEILHHADFRIENFPASGDEFDGYDPRDPTLTYKEITASNLVDPSESRYGKVGDHSIVILDIDDSTTNTKVPFNIWNQEPKLQLCALKRENNNPYGGTGESSLANTIYMQVGHFQIIDAAVLAEIESGGKYVFEEIEIFGGDTYIQLFDYQRTYKWNSGAENDLAFAHALTFPVESRMLLGYREGLHHARTRHYDQINNTGGLRYNSPNNIRTEDFNYNDGYTTDNPGDFYLPLPFNFSLQSEFSTRFRYTNQKSYSELQDAYRIFPAFNRIDVDTSFGEINNIKSKFGKIAYWQDDAIGYIPIEERQLSQTEVGNPVQIGIGGVFERFDEIIQHIGNQQQFGLVESDIGFHWIDSRRRIHITMTNSFKITEESITKGLDNWFQENVPYSFSTYDRPGYDYGIAGGYDRRHKLVLHTLRLPGGVIETIGFDLKTNAFVGFFDYAAYYYMLLDNNLYGMSIYNKREAYFHARSSLNRQIYGFTKNSYIELIIKDETVDPKIWDTMVASASSPFASLIRYTAGELPEEDIVAEYAVSWSPSVDPISFVGATRNYIFRNKKWYFNIPRLNRKRLLSDYLKVRFEWRHPYHRTVDVEFRDLTTDYRKAY